MVKTRYECSSGWTNANCFVCFRVNGTVYLSVNKVMKPFYSQGIYGIYPYQHHQSYSAILPVFV